MTEITQMTYSNESPLVLTQIQWPVRVFYDASCRMCAAEMHNLKVRDVGHRLSLVDCSTPGFDRGPAPTAQLMARMHCQDARGAVFSGVEAFRVLYHAVGLDGVQAALANPVVGGIARRLYPWIAAHRQQLPAWLIAPLFERAARRAAMQAAQRAQACQNGFCEMPAQATAHSETLATPAAIPQQVHTRAPKAVLLTGATGFIGRHIAAQLRAQGHHVVMVSRSQQPAHDFTTMVHASDWLPLLSDAAHPIDVVINAVGALRDSARQPLQAIHADAPMALFDACAQAGVRRVVQISALGIEGSDTAYARTKRQADAHLLALTQAGQLDGLVLRPSVVFGRGGESSQLFMNLAHLPVLPLPQPACVQPIQPMAVAELAQAIANLAVDAAAPTGLQAMTGTQALTMAQFIASLRAQMGKRPAGQFALPNWISASSARVGDWVPVSPWCSQAWALMRTPNCSDSGALVLALGRLPTPPSALLATWQTPA